jgi:SAM-dependent methyltransferase
MDSGLLDALHADLRDFRSEGEDPHLREILLGQAIPRLVATVDLIPESLRGGDVLQIGAEPYLLTLCLRRACPGSLTLVNYFGTGARRGEQVLVNRRTGESIRLAYDLCNVEVDDLPYPDASFDVVTFCEILEHLALNPVRALSEVHRVLRPGGVVIVTTPNCLSLLRLDGFLRGRSEIVDRYAPGFGYGARHNREYRPYEVRELLESTGFPIEEMAVRDLPNSAPMGRLARAAWKRLLARYGGHPREDHIFVRAGRAPRFRWTFPASLFSGLESYAFVRYPWLEVGVNDSIQCACGWSAPVPGRGRAGTRRWTAGSAQALLRSPEAADAVRLACFAHAVPGVAELPVRVIVRHRWNWPRGPSAVYGDAVLRVARGVPGTFAVPLHARPEPGEEIEVNITPDPDALISPALGGVPAAERGLAVTRVWFEPAPCPW